jgi:fumarylacetoacetate (FAA) hydrolase
MRLVTYTTDVGSPPAVGELVDGAVRELRAGSMIEWLSGEGRAPTGTEHAVAEVRLLAPVPEPPSYRDFIAYQGHLERAMRNIRDDDGLEAPSYWFKAPAFYFGNHYAILGPDQPVRRPVGVEMLDFELELAAIVDGNGGIAGFTLLNDWSARDVQQREATVGLGVHKSKDFGTSLGPWLVTPDELDYKDGVVRLSARVEVNGQVRTETNSHAQYFTWPSIVNAAARNTRLKAGDVIGSGTLDWGCNIEFGPLDDQRWVIPGETVALIADGLGALRTPVEQSDQ